MLRFRPAAIVALPLLLASTARADLRTFELDPRYQQGILAALRAATPAELVVTVNRETAAVTEIETTNEKVRIYQIN